MKQSYRTRLGRVEQAAGRPQPDEEQLRDAVYAQMTDAELVGLDELLEKAGEDWSALSVGERAEVDAIRERAQAAATRGDTPSQQELATGRREVT